MQKWTNNCLFWMVALPQCMKLWALVIPIWSTSVLYQWDFVLGAVKYIYILRVVGLLGFGHVMRGEGELVSRAFFRASLMLQVVVTVLTHTHRRGDFQPLDLWLEATTLLAEDLATVSAVVAPFSEGETHSASRAAVHLLILYPVICGRASGLITDRPAKHTATAVTYQDLTVVFWNGKRGDFRRMSVVLAVKRCVHGEFAPEHQLSLPSVAWFELVVRPSFHSAGLKRLWYRSMRGCRVRL